MIGLKGDTMMGLLYSVNFTLEHEVRVGEHSPYPAQRLVQRLQLPAGGGTGGIRIRSRNRVTITASLQSFRNMVLRQ
jgi:hypothetical protein